MAVEEQALHLSFDRLRQAWLANRPAYEQRIDDLRRLRERLESRLDEMAKAISADFGNRSVHETLLGEASIVFSEIDEALHRLKRWMKPQRRRAGWKMWPARAEIRYVPLGVVGSSRRGITRSIWRSPHSSRRLPPETTSSSSRPNIHRAQPNSSEACWRMYFRTTASR